MFGSVFSSNCVQPEHTYKGGPLPRLFLIIVVIMGGFANIPAAGDAYLSGTVEEEPEVESTDELEDSTKDGKYVFNGKHIYVTWSKSTIDDKDELHQKLLAILPVGVRVFGERELRADSTLSYHAMISFVEKMHWPDAAKKFSIEGDTNAIRFAKPKPRKRIRTFLESTVAYCSRDGDTFGENPLNVRAVVVGAVAEQKKRKWQDIFDETDEEKVARNVKKVAIYVKMGIRTLETVSLSLLSFIG